MAGQIERIAICENEIDHLTEKIDKIQSDFDAYKKSIEDEKRHKETMLYVKIGLLVTVIIAVLELLFKYVIYPK